MRKDKIILPAHLLNLSTSYLLFGIFIPTILLIFIITGCASQSHLVRGKEYLEKDKYDRSIKELEKAANEKGDVNYYIDTYSNLGDAYAKSGQVNNAIAIYRNALQIIQLRLREIFARRIDIRRELNSKSKAKVQGRQDEDMRLGNEEWKLKETEKGIKNKLDGLVEK